MDLTSPCKPPYPNAPLISKMTNNQQPTRLPDGQATNRGFTIVESLVAITILVLVVTGVTSAVQTSLSSYIFSKNQIIAFYLAQEGFEQIRNWRDENRLKDQDWLYGLDPCFSGNGCYFNPAFDNAPKACPAPGCPVVRRHDDTSFFSYGYGSGNYWTDTIFIREVSLEWVNSNEISVLVTVDWSKGAVNRQFKARENIFDSR